VVLSVLVGALVCVWILVVVRAHADELRRYIIRSWQEAEMQTDWEHMPSFCFATGSQRPMSTIRFSRQSRTTWWS